MVGWETLLLMTFVYVYIWIYMKKLQIDVTDPIWKKLRILKIECDAKNWTEFMEKIARDFKVME